MEHFRPNESSPIHNNALQWLSACEIPFYFGGNGEDPAIVIELGSQIHGMPSNGFLFWRPTEQEVIYAPDLGGGTICKVFEDVTQPEFVAIYHQARDGKFK